MLTWSACLLAGLERVVSNMKLITSRYKQHQCCNRVQKAQIKAQQADEMSGSAKLTECCSCRTEVTVTVAEAQESCEQHHLRAEGEPRFDVCTFVTMTQHWTAC